MFLNEIRLAVSQSRWKKWAFHEQARGDKRWGSPLRENSCVTLSPHHFSCKMKTMPPHLRRQNSVWSFVFVFKGLWKFQFLYLYGIIFLRHRDLWGLVLAAESCPTLSDPMDWTPPGSSVRGIFQARILEWIAIPISRGSSQPRAQTWVSHIAGRFLTTWATIVPSERDLGKVLEYVLSWPIDICPVRGRRYLTDSVSRQALQGWRGAFQDQVACLDVRESSWGHCTSETRLGVGGPAEASAALLRWYVSSFGNKQALASVKLLGKKQKEIGGVGNCFPKGGKSKAGMRLLLQPSFAMSEHVPSHLQSVIRVIDKHPSNPWPASWAMGTCQEELLESLAALLSLLLGLLWDYTTEHT